MTSIASLVRDKFRKVGSEGLGEGGAKIVDLRVQVGVSAVHNKTFGLVVPFGVVVVRQL